VTDNRIAVRSWHDPITDPNIDHVHTPTQLDGTIIGIILTVIVAVLALATLIALIFWAARQKPT
jgi:hypothetical protein